MPHVEVCSQQELPEVISLVDDAMRQRTGQTMLTDYPLVYQDSNLSNIRILKVGGHVVSVVPFLPRSVDLEDMSFTVGIISPTATSPDYRHQGYALSCLNSCITSMEEMDCDLSLLWTQIETFPFYENTGFEPVRYQEWIYSCTQKDRHLFRDHGHTIHLYDPSSQQYLDRIRTMHEEETYGVRRSRAEAAMLMDLPRSRTLVAVEDHSAVGYLVISDAVNKPGVIESGGKIEAIETLLRSALEKLPDKENLLAYDSLTGTIGGHLLQQSLPGRKELTSKSMMIRVNKPSAFLRKIQPWLTRNSSPDQQEFSIQVGETAEQISFQYRENNLAIGQHRLALHENLSRQGLTSLIFGPHPVRSVKAPRIGTSLFPFYFPIWQLDQS